MRYFLVAMVIVSLGCSGPIASRATKDATLNLPTYEQFMEACADDMLRRTAFLLTVEDAIETLKKGLNVTKEEFEQAIRENTTFAVVSSDLRNSKELRAICQKEFLGFAKDAVDILLRNMPNQRPIY